MSKKLSRHLTDIEKTEKKMAELKAHLEAVRQTQKADEDAEILKSIRSMNVKGWELVKLLEGIQNGSVELRPVEPDSMEEPDSFADGQRVLDDMALLEEQAGVEPATEDMEREDEDYEGN